MTAPTLSIINPDWNDIEGQLRNSLAGKSSWQALLDTDTATILLQSVAATGAFLAQAIQNVYEEYHSDTAKLGSSLKSIARTLGVRLQRKTPASATVMLTLPLALGSDYVIAAYSQFSSPGTQLFNRTAIIIPAGDTTQEVTLYEGTVQSQSFTGLGTPFQIFYVNVPGFTISDMDVTLTVDGNAYTVTQDAIWHYPTVGGEQNVVQDRTLPTGELELIFGNTQFGAQPGSTSSLVLGFVVTNGAAGNNLAFDNQQVSLVSDPTGISGLATAALINGADEPNPEVYRDSPLAYASYGRASSINDHPAIAFGYGNLADAIFLGQKDIAPTVVQFMNVVYVYLLKAGLPATQMDQTEFDTQFLPWLQPKAPPFSYVLRSAVAIPVNVRADVAIFGTGDPNTVKANIQKAVRALFLPRKGFIGRNLTLSDLYDAIKESDGNIDFLELVTPTKDVICRVGQPTGIVLTGVTGGALTPGNTYQYSVSSLDSQGETFITTAAQIVLGSGKTATKIDWTAVPGATGYRVYGNQNGTFVKIADLGATVYTFTDTIATPAGTVPPNQVDTSGLYYVSLNSLVINLSFTTRK